MTPLVVVILAVMWLLVLVPPLLRGRSDGRPGQSVSSFQRQLSSLQRTGPGTRSSVRRVPDSGVSRSPYAAGYSGPYRSAPSAASRRSSRAAARRRRQNVLLLLAGFSFLAGVMAFGMGVSVARYAFFVLLGLLAMYVLLLVQLARNEVASQRRVPSRVTYSRAA